MIGGQWFGEGHSIRAGIQVSAMDPRIPHHIPSSRLKHPPLPQLLGVSPAEGPENRLSQSHTWARGRQQLDGEGGALAAPGAALRVTTLWNQQTRRRPLHCRLTPPPGHLPVLLAHLPHSSAHATALPGTWVRHSPSGFLLRVGVENIPISSLSS